MKPLGCDPARVKGMSEKLIVSHCDYGGAVKRLNLIEEQVASPRFTIPQKLAEGLRAALDLVKTAKAGPFFAQLRSARAVPLQSGTRRAYGRFVAVLPS